MWFGKYEDEEPDVPSKPEEPSMTQSFIHFDDDFVPKKQKLVQDKEDSIFKKHWTAEP